ncbi:RluA family pseudouridine synthase [Neorhodopirellula pilleata]|uniref:Ribosomal large subunit pseudouridine synthase D n=1 Tax=Neorhodopirellula pilleata TaxID=2714738 RepID=A0A5C6AHN0_9BACT|nr:RluA family pseudouridine synthase [Neorhodopirellula pilleata]TWT98695.1 Ribosomal large subunit pseudouridine synthase D [Neorhodopirellula pilleata]
MANRILPSPRQPTGLLVYLFEILSDTKRTRVKAILRSGLVHVNGASITQHDTQIGGDDTIEIRSERATAKRSFPFEVLFEDAAILVINKPNGLLTVGNRHEKTRTVESIVNQALAEQRQRCYIVQRLDLYTSGVLLLAKTEFAQTRIKDNWGESEKIYHALVEGVPEPLQATLTHYLNEDDRLIVHANKTEGRNAIKATLSYHTLSSRDAHSLVCIKLKTGKKNQIRAQMSAIGHPVAGDAKYGATSNPIGRMCLHASSLSLRHPTTNEMLCFQAPLPKGMSF